MSSGHVHGGPECLALFERLSEYLDKEVDPTVCAGIEDHLADCERCKVFLESLRRAVAYVKDVAPPALPDEMKRDIVAAYQRARDGENPK